NGNDSGGGGKDRGGGEETNSWGVGTRALCGFRDGSLGVVDVRLRRGLWASKPGHTETVFACAHRPGDADTLATGSYDSTVKVWHAPTMD
ncbi:unnamed protein product, partial [Discosporangium mesarthrocarpum]